MFRRQGTPTLFATMLSALCAGLCAQQGDAPPAPAAFAARLQRILPGDDELAFLAVPWRTELRTALVDGDAQDKPVLLWAMNGHPLGQT